MKTIKIALTVAGIILFFMGAFALFEPGNDPTGFFVYAPSLAIINYDNNEPLNNNLEISFFTRGTDDLIITPLKGNIEFIELRCGNKILNPFFNDKEIIYENYHCRDKGSVLVKILSKKLDLEFRFGYDLQLMQNIVS